MKSGFQVEPNKAHPKSGLKVGPKISSWAQDFKLGPRRPLSGEIRVSSLGPRSLAKLHRKECQSKSRNESNVKLIVFPPVQLGEPHRRGACHHASSFWNGLRHSHSHTNRIKQGLTLSGLRPPMQPASESCFTWSRFVWYAIGRPPCIPLCSERRWLFVSGVHIFRLGPRGFRSKWLDPLLPSRLVYH